MDPEAGAPITPSVARDREVHETLVVGAPIPDHGGSRVAEHRAVDGQQGGEVPPARAHETVPDGIDALVDPIQPTPSDAHVDRRAAEAEPEQLLARDDAALSCGELGDPVIDGGFSVHVTE
ncbi:MAG TPA: hypothetical protein VH276_12845 [Solirubrobacteraceae bacterium]|nr:hypothetical protein [Solirubrobacteraceae bacterium]